MCYEVLAWAVFGLVVGGIARLLVPGQDPIGCLGTMALGIAGSIVGGFLGYMIFGKPYAPANFLGALVGAVIVVLIQRRLFDRRRP